LVGLIGWTARCAWFRSELADLNARIRTEGTRNLIEAARRSGSPKILAQSVAWQLPDGPDAQAVAELERCVLARAALCCAMDSSMGPAPITSSNHPRTSGSHRPSCRTNGGGAGRANGRRRHYRLSARPRSGRPSSCVEFGDGLAPITHTQQHGRQRPAEVRQLVFDLGRHLGKHRTPDNPIGFEFTQLKRDHSCRRRRREPA